MKSITWILFMVLMILYSCNKTKSYSNNNVLLLDTIFNKGHLTISYHHPDSIIIDDSSYMEIVYDYKNMHLKQRQEFSWLMENSSIFIKEKDSISDGHFIQITPSKFLFAYSNIHHFGICLYELKNNKFLLKDHTWGKSPIWYDLNKNYLFQVVDYKENYDLDGSYDAFWVVYFGFYKADTLKSKLLYIYPNTVNNAQKKLLLLPKELDDISIDFDNHNQKAILLNYIDSIAQNITLFN